MGFVATFARVLHVLATGLWLGAGALVLLLGSLIPETLDSRQAAEAVMSAARARLDLYGTLAGPVVLVTLAAGWAPMQVPLRFRALLALGATGAAAFSGQYLVPRMREVMDAMGRPLEDLPPADPFVAEYLDLSTASMGALALQVAAAFLLVALGVAASKPKRRYGLEL